MRVIFYVFLFLVSLRSVAQQTDAVDFLKGQVTVTIDAKTKTVDGEVVYTFKVLQNTASIYIDAQSMEVKEVHLDEKKTKFTYDNKKIIIASGFSEGSNHSVTIKYIAKPKKALYFVKDYEGNDQVWTQGQGKYTSNWLPSFDEMKEKVEFDLTINYEKGYEAISNGKLVKSTSLNETTQSWQYDMQHPMSSYLVAIAIGKYEKEVETSESGIGLEMYYYPSEKNKYEYTYAHSKRMFDFLEKEIGYAFPWQNYKQIPVKDFLYAGMENTSATIFSDAFLVDEIAFNDRNYVNVNAHELAHQWFGDLVTEAEGTHHWLQEGFATYYALLVEKEIFGEEYFLYKLYESAEQLTELSKTPDATSLLNPKASSLTFYQRGAWAIHALRNLIGETSFKITVHNYLEKYKFKNATTDDFIAVAEEVSGKQLSEYKKSWLENVKFPSQKALDILTKSPFIKKYLNLAQERTQPLAGKWGTLASALGFPLNDYIGQEVVYQLEGETSPEGIALYEKAFETNNLYVRQTIATTLQRIPRDLKEAYESLLDDPSYATIEPALYHLWANFTEDREKYLDQTKDIIGFNDKNVRILWLVLALSTGDYQTAQHQKFYRELSSYSSPKYHFTTRENALVYLESLQAFSDQSLKDLVDGATHHNWRFRNSCRKILDNLLKNEKYKKKYVVLMSGLPQNQQDFLQKKLTP
ncbi:M1 family metallopeptidase [Aquimarina sp. 2201CG5-10]|uniref:M1 family metallopeptidase n=1 Tax=Aquimarina callyspongiae TaxID=3098150 RepID=UPI002AB47F4E|nr:M1 family metallopeptidase [Aquimarina sp. 2201CG5-10]MDY8135478.1 M1 family metallopeptidase [Aquimarina sp. 2201CG5-10]